MKVYMQKSVFIRTGLENWKIKCAWTILYALHHSMRVTITFNNKHKKVKMSVRKSGVWQYKIAKLACSLLQPVELKFPVYHEPLGLISPPLP